MRHTGIKRKLSRFQKEREGGCCSIKHDDAASINYAEWTILVLIYDIS